MIESNLRLICSIFRCELLRLGEAWNGLVILERSLQSYKRMVYGRKQPELNNDKERRNHKFNIGITNGRAGETRDREC